MQILKGDLSNVKGIPPSGLCVGVHRAGAGDQARLHLLALTCIRTSINKVRVFSPTRETREKFAAEMSAVLRIEVSAAESAAAQGVDSRLHPTRVL